MAANPFYMTDPGVSISPVSYKDVFPNSKVYAHALPYVGQAKHLNRGYSMQDPDFAAKHVSDLKAHGVDGMIFDWYGQDDAFSDKSTQVWYAELQKQGLSFIPCFDRGIVNFHCPKTMTPTAYMVKQIQYALKTYPNWTKSPDGRLLALEFGWETLTTLDAGAVLSGFPQLAMLWQNASGFSKPKAAGAYAWAGATYNDPNPIEAYQKAFLAAAAQHPKMLYMASLCKGFDDHNRWPGGDPTQSAWGGPARIVSEKQGQTWLNVIALLQAAQPKYIQLVTLNDPEEGTDLIWGIDSQLTVSLSREGSIVTVNLAGNVNTVSIIQLFVDGEYRATFFSLEDLTFDLNKLDLGLGPHTIQAFAFGKLQFMQKQSEVLTATSVIDWV